MSGVRIWLVLTPRAAPPTSPPAHARWRMNMRSTVAVAHIVQGSGREHKSQTGVQHQLQHSCRPRCWKRRFVPSTLEQSVTSCGLRPTSDTCTPEESMSEGLCKAARNQWAGSLPGGGWVKNPTAPAVQVSRLRDCVKNPLQCKRRLGAVCSAVQEPDSECQAPLNLSGAVMSCSGVERACEPLGAQAAGSWA